MFKFSLLNISLGFIDIISKSCSFSIMSFPIKDISFTIGNSFKVTTKTSSLISILIFSKSSVLYKSFVKLFKTSFENLVSG